VTATAAGDTLVLSEVFGPTVQGEGPAVGRRCGFVRLGGCNLTCTWCDTAYTWDADRYDLRAELTRTPVGDILDQVDAMDVPMVVISGGEPLLHQLQPGWRSLLGGLAARGIDVHVETNGTRPPAPYTRAAVAQFVVSPKLAHAGDPEDKRIVPPALAALVATDKAVFKFVATSTDDLPEIAAVAAAAGIPDRLVWVMPEGVTPDAVVAGGAAIADAVVSRGWNLTTRLHVLCWPKERAR